MLKYCLDKWNKNKGLLEEKLRKDSTLNSCDYSHLVCLVVEFILNPRDDYEWDDMEWDDKNITVVDNGDYQGTQLFLIPLKTYQPSEYDYLMTYVGYGSCYVCDALLSIQDWDDEPATETQIKDFMTLCKDLVTNMVKPYNSGWRFKEGFTEVTMNNDP